MIETLESRIAPALLLPGGRGFTYTDIDGDFVTVKFSKPVVAEPAIRDAVTIFAGGPNWGQNTTPENLLTLDLTKAVDPALVIGLDITITAQQRGTGDGYVHMYGIAASNPAAAIGDILADLGKVKVDGWLNFFYAGDASAADGRPALKSLEVQGLGDQFENQPVRIYGSVGSLVVKGNVTSDLFIAPFDVNDIPKVTVGKIAIGGSLLAGRLGDGGSLALAARSTGAITIGGNVVGGSADDSGSIVSILGSVKALTIRGSIVGGDGVSSGTVVLPAIEAKLGGSVIGGDGEGSGRLGVFGRKLAIGGSIVGGEGKNSGLVAFGTGIESDAGNLSVKGATVAVGGDIVTAHHPEAGKLLLEAGAGAIAKVTVGGSLINRLTAVPSTPGGSPAQAGGSIHFASDSGTTRIESIVIGGTLRGGNISGNALAGADGYFGTNDDVRAVAGAVAAIGRIVVNGGVEQVASPGTFGIVATDLGTVQLGRLTLSSATANFGAGISVGAFVRVREI